MSVRRPNHHDRIPHNPPQSHSFGFSNGHRTGSRIVEVLPEMLYFVASALEDGIPPTQQRCRYFFKYTRCSGIHRIVAPFEHQPHLLVLKLSL
jgi:hypothetical protein